jgi:biopolymer transport protein TolR
MNVSRSSRKKNGPLMAEINVVPYIDVMLVLLVIFMITAPLLSQGVKINLPQAQSKPLLDKNNQPMIISIDSEGRYYLNLAADPKKPLLADVLVNQMKVVIEGDQRHNQQRSILIKGDRDANYGKIMQAMVLLQSAGIDNVGLMTESPSETHLG